VTFPKHPRSKEAARAIRQEFPGDEGLQCSPTPIGARDPPDSKGLGRWEEQEGGVEKEAKCRKKWKGACYSLGRS
jgi:hypothetical protein